MGDSAPRNIGITPKKNGQATRHIANGRRGNKKVRAKKNRLKAKAQLRRELDEAQRKDHV